MPFTHLSWNAPQAMVVETGVTFILQPVEIGANQVPLPIGDPHPITCGAFECAMGMDAPEITIENSMACTMWEPTLELQVGLIDNSLSEHIGAAAVVAVPAGVDPPTAAVSAAATVTVFDGLDLGWTYTSSLATKVTHDLTVVSSDPAAVKKASSATPLGATSIGRISLSSGETVATDQTYYALSAEPDEDRRPTLETSGSCRAA